MYRKNSCTEAYFGWSDPASHAYGKKITERNIILYKNPGTAYVYLVYGNNWLLDVVTEKAVKELLRVAKKDAPIFASVISRLGLLKTLLIEFQHEIHYAKHHLEVGDYVPGVHGEGFTAAHWFQPEELRHLFEAQGVKVLEMASLEGLSSHHRKETNRLYKDEEKWKIWMEIILKTCTHPAVVGSSEHFLLVGKKTN